MENLVCYKQLPVWTHDTIPTGFQRQHNTKVGTWAKLNISKGEVRFAMLDEDGKILSEHIFSSAQPAPFILPQAWHKIVSASGDVECQLSFYCQPEDYFSKKYQLTTTHSEILAALPYLTVGRVLDVGCGSGRNTLYLSQQDFQVDAWDINPDSIEKLNDIVVQENIRNIQTRIRDLNLDYTIEQHYDFICCTVVMMFLQPETVRQLIPNMQQATQSQGLNLIVCAMDSEDYPVQPDFPFSFRSGELLHAYQGWNIIKYNEDVGELHRVDTQGQRIKQRFATLLAQKI